MIVRNDNHKDKTWHFTVFLCSSEGGGKGSRLELETFPVALDGVTWASLRVSSLKSQAWNLTYFTGLV